MSRTATLIVVSLGVIGCDAAVRSGGDGGASGSNGSTGAISATVSAASASTGGGDSTIGTSTTASTADAASSSSFLSPVGTGTAGTFETPFPPPECEVDEVGSVNTPTLDAFVAQLVGRWLHCGPGDMFAADEDGIEIDPDGHWYKLAVVSPGVIERTFGFGNEGTWEVLDVGEGANSPLDRWQINIMTDDGFRSLFAAFSVSPRKMLAVANSQQGFYAWHP